jgi:iron(III) transport system substrate-binding protein
MMLRALGLGLRKRTPSPQRGEGWGEGSPTERPEPPHQSRSFGSAFLTKNGGRRPPTPLPYGEREKWWPSLLIIVCLAAAIPAHAENIADIASLSGPDRTQRLIDGAKKESVISLYSSAVTDDSNAIAAAFEKKYGVKVQLWRGSSEDILRRAVTEHRGGRNDVDVAETAGTEMEGLRREQLLQEVSSPVFAELIPQAVAPHRPWVTSRLSIFTAAFNTTLIQPKDTPKTYEDLTDPQWKGKLGIEADDANWFMSIAGAMGEDKAVALFRNIVARNGMSMRKGHTLLSNLVVAGEVPLALTVYGYRINELKAKGAPIDGTVLPPAVALPTGIAVFAQAPHPYAAALFMDFFLGDGQRILLDRGNVPTNRTVREPPPGLAFVDVAKFLDQGDKWTKLFKEIFASGGR